MDNIALDNRGYQVICFTLFSRKTYAVGTHQKRFAEALLMSTNVFSWRNKKNIFIQEKHFLLKKEPYLGLWYVLFRIIHKYIIDIKAFVDI